MSVVARWEEEDKKAARTHEGWRRIGSDIQRERERERGRERGEGREVERRLHRSEGNRREGNVMASALFGGGFMANDAAPQEAGGQTSGLPKVKLFCSNEEC